MARKRSVKKKSGNKERVVKGHTRSPRGSDTGKKPVRVKGYKRRKPQR